MTLSALIRKRDTGNLATAIPAISATQPKWVAGRIARIATVAVATPQEEKPKPPVVVGAGELNELIRTCGEAYHFTKAEFTEAMEVASRDPVNALICFRAIASSLAKGGAPP